MVEETVPWRFLTSRGMQDVNGLCWVSNVRPGSLNRATSSATDLSSSADSARLVSLRQAEMSKSRTPVRSRLSSARTPRIAVADEM